MPFAHSGFLLDEDEALKAHLSGMNVADERSSGRAVTVRFGYGDPELTGNTPGGQVTWPYITIALLDIQEETDRAHRGRVHFEYAPGSPDQLSSLTGNLAEWPIPVAIDYEIVAHSRSARHDRQIMAQMVANKLPFRFGSLAVDDGTVRRLDVLSGPEDAPRLHPDGKREYRTVWTVRVSSELAVAQIAEVGRATGAFLTILNLSTRQDRDLTSGDTASAADSEVVS